MQSTTTKPHVIISVSNPLCRFKPWWINQSRDLFFHREGFANATASLIAVFNVSAETLYTLTTSRFASLGGGETELRNTIGVINNPARGKSDEVDQNLYTSSWLQPLRSTYEEGEGNTDGDPKNLNLAPLHDELDPLV